MIKKIIKIFSFPAISCEAKLVKNDLVIFLFESNKCFKASNDTLRSKYLNSFFNLTIFKADNLIIYHSIKIGTDLLGGLVINLKKYDEGEYVFKIDSQYFNEVFRFNKSEKI